MNNALAIPTIPIDQIIPSPSNPRKRFDETYLQELAASLREHGMLQPITVRPLPLEHLFEYNRKNRPRDDYDGTPTYEIVVGECRWRAARLAGLTEVPAFWRELDDKEVLEIQVIENQQRRDVHPIEEADGYRQLIDKHNYRAEDLAEKIGKSRSYIYGRMKLSALGELGREMFYANEFEASVALMIARLHESDQVKMLKQLRIASAGAGEPISFRDAKWRIRNGFTIDLSRATFPLDDAGLLPAAGSCADCPKRSGNSPEICPDIDSADVCTDTRCFEEKRLARRAQLLDQYREKQVPIYVDDDAKMIAPSGQIWSVDRDKWLRLTDGVPGDPEGRSYAEVLGDQAPVSLVVEVGKGFHSQLLELVEDTAMTEAMARAGWSVETAASEVGTGNAHSVSDGQRQRDRETAARAVENVRRKALLTRIVEALSGDIAPLGIERSLESIVAALVLAQLRQEYERGEEIFIALEYFGFEIPEEYDELEELEKFKPIIATWPLGKMLALLVWINVQHEMHCDFSFDGTLTETPSLDAFARLLGLPDVAEDPPPADAAQASDSLREEGENPTSTAAPAGGLMATVTAVIESEEKPLTDRSFPVCSTAVASVSDDNRDERRKPPPGIPYQSLQNVCLTWSGKGRRPEWVKAHLAAGGTLDELKVCA